MMWGHKVEKRDFRGAGHGTYFFSYGMKRKNLAGFPATIAFASTFFVTTLPAPMIAFSPIVTLLRMVEPDPIEAPFFTNVFSTFQSASVCNAPPVVARG